MTLSCYVEVGAKHKKYLVDLANAAGDKTGRSVPLREMLAHVLDFVMEKEKHGTSKHRQRLSDSDWPVQRRKRR